MIGLALEIRGQCGSCGNPLPFNALCEQVVCPRCHTPRVLGAEAWRSLLEDALRDAPQLQPREGRSSTIFTGDLGQVELTAGRAEPRCPACKTEMPLDDLDALAARGWAICVGCGRRHTLRRPQPAFEGLLPPGALVAFEDEDQLAGRGDGISQAATAPVVFACPQCQASLPLDGSGRMVTCGYCHANVYLPDELWQRLHPAHAATRWYVCFDPARVLFAWEDVYEAVIDRQGNVYCAGEPAVGDTAVWSLDPERRTRWRTAVELDDDSRLALTPNGHLLVGNPTKHALLVLGCADGAEVGKVGGAAAPGGPPALDFAGAASLTCDADGTILVFTHDELRRFAADGRRIEVWPNARAREEDAPSLEDIRERPVQLRTDGVRATSGYDGFTYLWEGQSLVKLSRWGQIVWRTKLPFDAKPRPCADARGWVFVLGETGLARVAPDGRVFPHLGPQSQGGPLGDEDRLALAPDATLWLFGGGGRLRLLGPDGAVRYRSPRSEEADEERRARPAAGDW
jgi:hypothetical protein